MKKRYQVFLSSTYRDLIEERQQVTTALMKMDCIPAGMELFPAIDLEQFEFIKKVIDDSDYYFIMVAGKYGTISPETGLSYTEMEYDYAVGKGLKIIALIYRDINQLTRDKTETDPEVASKLEAFRQKISTGRLVNFWSNLSELPGYVAISLSQTMTMFPAEGWVRAGEAPSEELLMDLNNLRKENAELKERGHSIPSIEIPNIADLYDEYELRGSYYDPDDYIHQTKYWRKEFTWSDILSMLAPIILIPASVNIIKNELTELISLKVYDGTESSLSLDTVGFNTIKVQMMCYGFIEIYEGEYSDGSKGEFWKLTEKGKLQMMSSMAVKK